MLVTELIQEVSSQALSQVALEPFIYWALEKTPLAIEHDAAAIVLDRQPQPIFYLRMVYPLTENYILDFKKKVIDGYCFETKEKLKDSDFQFVVLKALGFAGEKLRTGGLASFYLTPLVVRKKFLGVIAISSTIPDSFLVYKLNMFGVFVNQVALSVDSLLSRQQIITQARIIQRDSINMKNAFKGMSEGLIMTDEKGDLVLVNPACLRMLSYKKETNLAELNLKVKPIIAPLLEKLNRSDNGFASMDFEMQNPLPIVLRMEASLAKDKDSAPIGAVIIMRDITSEKEVDRMKSEFVSIVSHELRTPLTTIREAVAQMLDGLLGPITNRQQEFLSICLQDIDRLTRIINDLLDISKIEAKKIELRKKLIDIVSLAQERVTFFSNRAKEKGLFLKVESNQKQIQLYIDSDKISQVFNNLIGNALKFTQEGGITILLENQQDNVYCSVSDTGLGIAQEDLPKVFSKFEQFKRIEGPGEKGTGLGLAIAKGLIEAHGGSITVKSIPKQGTCFCFILPKFQHDTFIRSTLEGYFLQADRQFKTLFILVVQLNNSFDILQKEGSELFYQILVRIALAVQQAIKAQEFISKSGKIFFLGEEDTRQHSEVIKHISNVLSSFSMTIEEKQFNLACSCSYFSYPSDKQKIDELF
ncbi:MAG: cell wall metabolism sensor histidine kinase WalK [Candidatus Omnitrophica bacterium]|nr:cell wall metabolism sensor histidine kinase WalK [Candidatus Omnitrophota bacterium]